MTVRDAAVARHSVLSTDAALLNRETFIMYGAEHKKGENDNALRSEKSTTLAIYMRGNEA